MGAYNVSISSALLDGKTGLSPSLSGSRNSTETSGPNTQILETYRTALFRFEYVTFVAPSVPTIVRHLPYP